MHGVDLQFKTISVEVLDYYIFGTIKDSSLFVCVNLYFILSKKSS